LPCPIFHLSCGNLRRHRFVKTHMRTIALALGILLSACTFADKFTVQFAEGAQGKTVAISVDGQVRQTFAGKLGLRSENASWLSVCANVRKHISGGQYFGIELLDSTEAGANLKKAGNIVAKYFHEAQTPEQCAALQLAVWEALEDGGAAPDFYTGKFAVRADPITMAYAEKYYTAVAVAGKAKYLRATDGGSQSQLTTAPST
jgi:hypothetical protein